MQVFNVQNTSLIQCNASHVTALASKGNGTVSAPLLVVLQFSLCLMQSVRLQSIILGVSTQDQLWLLQNVDLLMQVVLVQCHGSCLDCMQCHLLC